MTATACDVGRATAGEGNAPETLARRLRTHLQVVAKQRVPITYQEAVNAVRLTAPNTIHQVTDALEHLMAEDPASGRPFIAAIVISKARGGLPAPGFAGPPGPAGRLRLQFAIRAGPGPQALQSKRPTRRNIRQ
jgi:hypothetical protein